ncbi:MAG: lysophospholipase [Hyphomicrobiales bacterium]|nr:lysophospholipase [Hyphomicrobiales bacterium]
MSGTKAQYLSNFSKKNRINFFRFDYFGHGRSSKEFNNCVISDWLNNGIKIMDQIIDNEVILIGSSMGGWISTLVSLKRRKKVKGLILIAPALDMTENLMWKKFSLKEKKLIKSQGYIERYVEDYDSSYRITKNLIDDGRKHLILKDKINLNIPIRIFHGIKDDSVPWKLSLDLMSSFLSDDINVSFNKNGDHSLSSDSDLKSLGEAILDVYNN